VRNGYGDESGRSDERERSDVRARIDSIEFQRPQDAAEKLIDSSAYMCGE
jgi:hypothetical protein